MLNCPKCKATHLVNNGKTHATGKQNYKCRERGRK